jgi:xanthine/CO dehydrogenase XdhC/CoxF family maturation factor
MHPTSHESVDSLLGVVGKLKKKGLAERESEWASLSRLCAASGWAEGLRALALERSIRYRGDPLGASLAHWAAWSSDLESCLIALEMGAGADAYGLVLTHDHALDYALVSAGLAGGGFGYFGVIGSKTKRARFMKRLRDDGFSEAVLTRLTCPIGLPHLKSKAPEVIAVSVAADLLMRQEAARIRNDETASASV